MSYHIHETWKEALIRSPETGMGYQVVEVQLSQPEHVIVLNGRLALDLKESPARFREGSSELRKSLLNLKLGSERGDTSFRVLGRHEALAKGLVEKASYPTGRGPASDARPEQSAENEAFLRFSAFVDDVRILADGSVVPGTYVTTRTDGERVRTGKDAVERYALPNPDPAVNRFWLRPPARIQVRRGTVQPANGHLGGGDEVIFDGGAPPKTKYKQDQLPSGT